MRFEKILEYYMGELSGEEKEQIESYLRTQAYHFEILEGLSKIEKELKGGENLRDFLERKKQFINQTIFEK